MTYKDILSKKCNVTLKSTTFRKKEAYQRLPAGAILIKMIKFSAASTKMIPLDPRNYDGESVQNGQSK